MVKITDHRSNRKEENSHTEVLEEIVKKNTKPSLWNKLKKAGGQFYSLAETAGAGYIVGYLISKDSGVATQTAEYAGLLWFGWKLQADIPFTLLKTIYSKKIDEFCAKYKRAIVNENRVFEDHEKKGEVHKFEIRQGLSFKNHCFNLQAFFENKVKKNYERALNTARNPFPKKLFSAFGGGLAFLTLSLAMDIPSHIFDYITGINPLEYGVDCVHYLSQQASQLTNYISSTTPENTGNFNQAHMLLTGGLAVLMKTSKEFLVGNYYRARALVKRTPKK